MINKRSSLLLVLALSAIAAAIHFAWIVIYRQQHLFDIDEAGYLSIALNNARAFRAHGIVGWAASVLRPSIQPPVVPALASILLIPKSSSLICAFLIPIGFGAVVTIASYFLALALMGPGASLLSAALVASCPAIVDYSRSFHFAIAATALFLLSILFLFKTQGFRSLAWSLLFGVALGMMPLARTMTVAFIPGIAVSGSLSALHPSGQRQRRILCFFLSLLFASILPLSWLMVTKWASIHYLLSFGYGSRASEFGPQSSLLSFKSWLLTLNQLLSYVHLPYAIIFLVGGLCLLGVAIDYARRRGAPSAQVGQVGQVGMRLPSLSIILLGGLSALTSSQNKGSAFVLPLVPVLIIMSVYAINAMAVRPFARRVLGASGIITALIVFLSSLNFVFFSSFRIMLLLPLLNWRLALFDGTSVYEKYRSYYDSVTARASAALPSYRRAIPANQRDSAWKNSLSTITNYLARYTFSADNAKPVLIFGFRHFLINPNTISLSLLAGGYDALPVTMIEPVLMPHSRYAEWLRKSGGSRLGLLLLLDNPSGTFPPAVRHDSLSTAAAHACFFQQASWVLPSGQLLSLYRYDPAIGEPDSSSAVAC